jgi:hypothetical protein
MGGFEQDTIVNCRRRRDGSPRQAGHRRVKPLHAGQDVALASINPSV